jgi:antitoxin YefM
MYLCILGGLGSVQWISATPSCRHPVLEGEARIELEVGQVVGHQRDAQREGMGCEKWQPNGPAGAKMVRFNVRSSQTALMASLSATEARKRLYALIDEVAASHEPVQITGKRGNAVLLSESDWKAIQETLHLVSIPGMRESILEGLALPVEELSDQPDW